MDILESSTVRNLPWYRRWRYQGVWTIGGGLAYHELSKGAMALDSDLFLGKVCPSHQQMKKAEAKLYDLKDEIIQEDIDRG